MNPNREYGIALLRIMLGGLSLIGNGAFALTIGSKKAA